MEIYIDQVPENVDFSDYPKGTVFIFEDIIPQRDPKTFRLIPMKRRKLLYPEDVRRIESAGEKSG